MLFALLCRTFHRMTSSTNEIRLGRSCFFFVCLCAQDNNNILAPSGGGTGTGDWKTDGQHYRHCQGVHLPVPAAVRGTSEGKCGLISKHIHSQLAHCNPLLHFLNVLVSTGFVLVGQKIIINLLRC